MTPQRIQRKRTSGWQLPDGAIIVTRPSRWGNPYPVSRKAGPDERRSAVAQFKAYALSQQSDWIAPLRGRDLACWCPLDKPCHADVLLEMANR